MTVISSQQNMISETLTWDRIKNQIPKQKIYQHGNLIQKIFWGYTNPISKENFSEDEVGNFGNLTRDEILDLLIKKALTKIAIEYIGRKNLKQPSLNASCRIIRNYFSHLGIPELLLAFELAFARKIEVDTNLYGNEFGAEYVGRVLGTYNNYRKEVIKIIRIAEIELNNSYEGDEEEKRIKNAKARLKMIEEISNCYQKFYHELKYKAPLGSYRLLYKLGFKIEPNQESKNEYSSKIFNIVRAQLSPKKEDQSDNVSPESMISNFFDELKHNDISPEEFQKKLQQKLKVYEKQ